MTVLIALFAGVLVTAWGAPRLLEALLARGFSPNGILLMWATLLGVSLLVVLGALLAALLPAQGPFPGLLHSLHHCWTTLRHGEAPRAHESLAAMLLFLLVCGSVLTGRRLVVHVRRQRGLHRRQSELLRVAAKTEPGPVPTMWLPHPEPLAYSVAGPSGFIVASEGLREQLGEEDMAAVLTHERAHLRGRHHLLVGVAEALAASAPWLPLLRRAPKLVRTAVELSADRAAARNHGASTVRSALLSMSLTAGGAPAGHALGMVDDHLAVRLRHLGRFRRSGRTARRIVRSTTAALSGALLPLLGAGTGFVLAATVICPVLFDG